MIDGFEACNWREFYVTLAQTSIDGWKVQAIAGGCVLEARELYNVVDDVSAVSHLLRDYIV